MPGVLLDAVAFASAALLAGAMTGFRRGCRRECRSRGRPLPRRQDGAMECSQTRTHLRFGMARAAETGSGVAVAVLVNPLWLAVNNSRVPTMISTSDRLQLAPVADFKAFPADNRFQVMSRTLARWFELGAILGLDLGTRAKPFAFTPPRKSLSTRPFCPLKAPSELPS